MPTPPARTRRSPRPSPSCPCRRRRWCPHSRPAPARRLGRASSAARSSRRSAGFSTGIGEPDPGTEAYIGAYVVRVSWADLQPTPYGPIVTDNAIDAAIARVRQPDMAGRMSLKLRVLAGVNAPEWVKQIGGPPLPYLNNQPGRTSPEGRSVASGCRRSARRTTTCSASSHTATTSCRRSARSPSTAARPSTTSCSSVSLACRRTSPRWPLPATRRTPTTRASCRRSTRTRSGAPPPPTSTSPRSRTCSAPGRTSRSRSRPWTTAVPASGRAAGWRTTRCRVTSWSRRSSSRCTSGWPSSAAR